MQHQQVQHILIRVQDELRALNLWQQSAPPPEALLSTQPFAMDTLSFHQWLQFIMIPRMQTLVVNRLPLPAKMAVSPMAVEVYRGQLTQYRGLIQCLRELDQSVSGEAAETLDQDHA